MDLTFTAFKFSFRVILALTITALVAPRASLAAEPQGTGLLLLEAGKSSVGEALVDYVENGDAYRVKLFGGMKLDIPLVSAAGLGIDFTFHSHALKEDFSGHYNRATWDWFYLPISIGPINITPGLGWNITDIQIEELGISEISIRPHAMINTGLTLAIFQHFALTVDARYERIWDDFEPTLDGRLNITGDHVSVFAGMMTYF
ncbi:hypothetical protein N9W79_00220 [bacterium]|nr:hypothetical protein [bacterium]